MIRLETRGAASLLGRLISVLRLHDDRAHLVGRCRAGRASAEQSSFVISEDDYIDYLTRTDISNLPPVKLAEKLRNRNFLFFGYSLRDWTLRVILHRIWGDQQRNYTSWAVQLNPQDLDERFWRRRDVEIIDADLEHYIKALSQRVQTLPMQKRAEVRE